MCRGSQFATSGMLTKMPLGHPWIPPPPPLLRRADRFIRLCKLARNGPRYLEKGIWFSVRSPIPWSRRRSEQRRARLRTASIGRALSRESAIKMAVTSRGARPCDVVGERRRRLAFYIVSWSRWRALSRLMYADTCGTRWTIRGASLPTAFVTVLNYLSRRWSSLFSRAETISRQSSLSLDLSNLNLEVRKVESSRHLFRVKLVKAQDDATSAEHRLLRQYHRGSQLYDVLHVPADHERHGLAAHERRECRGKRVLLRY